MKKPNKNIPNKIQISFSIPTPIGDHINYYPLENREHFYLKSSMDVLFGYFIIEMLFKNAKNYLREKTV